MSYSSVIHFSKSSNPDLFEDKGLKFSPLSFVGGLEVGEKSVSIYPQFID